jgi:4'-phosphopantetheinyl transferase EntD
VAHLILRPEEFEKEAGPDLPALHSLRQVFCAKESVYKANSTRANRFVDFQEVLINFDPATCRFTATAPEDSQLNALLCAGEGRYVVADKFLFAVWFHQLGR